MASGPGKQSRQRPPVVDRPPNSKTGHPKTGRVGLATRMRNYFFAGVLVAAPISITIWITWNLLQFIDSKVTPLVPPVWNPETYLPFSIPGVGLILAIIVLALVGFMAAGIVGRSVMRFGERMLARVPVVRSLYSATKQIFETVLAQKSTAFRQVALVEYPMRGTWAVGFITGQTVGEVQNLTDETVFNVFVPATPNPTTGFLLFLPERDVHILAMTVEEGIKLVVSGGIVTPDSKRVAPSPGTDPGPQPQQAQDEKARNRQPGALRRLRNYFLAGILVTAPMGITFWLVWKLISFVDQSVLPLIPQRWNPETYLPFDIPGLGLIVALVAFTLIGMLTAGFVGKLFMRTGERILGQVPFVRSLYGATKQITTAVLEQKSNAFREVVLIQYPRPESWAIGFITGETEGHIQEIPKGPVTNVFLPTTPNPTSGFLLFVPTEELKHLAMTVEQGLKMVVSGGIVTPDSRDREEREDSDRPDEVPASRAAREGLSESPGVKVKSAGPVSSSRTVPEGG